MRWKWIVSAAVLLTAWQASGQIYTGNSAGNRVTVHAIDADGNAAPIREISGPATGLAVPFAIALDGRARELFVSNRPAHSVAVFDLDADGDAVPIRTIVGASSQLNSPIGLHVDRVNNELFVRNFGGTQILIFDLDADGNVPPIREISGPATGVSLAATDLFVDSVHDEILLANRAQEGAVLIFARGASGNVAPVRTIRGPSTGLTNPYGIFVDIENDEIYTAGSQEILVFDRSASGDAAPIRRFSDPAIAGPTGVFVDHRRNEVFVSYQGNNTIAAFPRTADGKTPALRIIEGLASRLENPTLLAADTVLVFLDGFESGDLLSWSASTCTTGC